MINNRQNIESEARNKISFVFFSVWTFILIARPQDYFLFLVPLRPVLGISVLTMAAMFFGGIRLPRNLFRLREVRLILLLYLIMIAGIPFAVHRRVAFDFVLIILPRTLLYFFVFIILVQSVKRLNAIAWVAVISALFTGLFYIKDAIHSVSLGYRLDASQTYDPNDIAMVFATYLPLSLYFLFSQEGVKKKFISITAAFSMVIGIMLSQSRGGVLALAVVLSSMVLFKTSRWKASHKVATIAALSILSFYYFVGLEQRFPDIKSDYNVTSEEGRLHIWKQNLAILSRRPVFGVGANCSAIALGLYRAERNGSQKWQVTHSSLIQLAVEIGVPGLVVVLMLNVGAILYLRKIRKSQDHVLSLLSFFLEICFYGFWAGGLFLSHGYSINLYFLLAMMATIRCLDENSDLRYGGLRKEPVPSDLTTNHRR